MKQPLFYIDPYARNFTATILKQEQALDGQWYVVLDQTALNLKNDKVQRSM